MMMGNGRKQENGDRKESRNDKGSDHSKRPRREDFSQIGDEGYKGVHTVFTKSIHRIMFQIKDEPYFEWPRPLGGDPEKRNKKLRYSYHRDHGLRTEECKTLKQFLEGLVTKGHLVEFVKVADRAGKKKVEDISDDDQAVKAVPKTFGSVIDVIHGYATKNAIRAYVKRAQCVEREFGAEVLSISAYKKKRKSKQAYVIKFTKQDMRGVDTPHNDALVLTVNINTFDVKRVLIDPRSSSEIMYYSMFKKLNLPPSQVKSIDSPVFSFSGEAVWPIAIAVVLVRLGPKQKMVEFIVMDIDSPYNAILGKG